MSFMSESNLLRTWFWKITPQSEVVHPNADRNLDRLIKLHRKKVIATYLYSEWISNFRISIDFCYWFDDSLSSNCVLKTTIVSYQRSTGLQCGAARGGAGHPRRSLSHIVHRPNPMNHRINIKTCTR